MAFFIVDARRSPLAKALQDRFHNELASGFVKYYVVDPLALNPPTTQPCWRTQL